MAIIKTYPLKSNYFGSDKFLISDMQPDSEGNVSGDTKNITFSSIKSLIGGGAATLQLTTTGTSGAATFDVNTNILNVPDYSIGNVDGSGTAGRIPLWADSNTLGDSQIFQSGVNIGVGTTTPGFKLDVDGDTRTDCVWFRSNTSSSPSSIAGFYRPSLGAVAYGYNTNEFFRIAADGKVGIGTTNPLEKLDIRGILRVSPDQASATQTGIILKDNGAGASEGLNIEFQSASDTNTAFIGSIGYDNFRIGTAGVERMRIDSLGNVGIGTTAPVANANRTTLALQGIWGGQLDVMVGAVVHAQFGTDNFGSGLSARVQSKDGIIFKVNTSTEALRIASSGNVGIGVTSPTSKLHVNGLIQGEGINSLYIGILNLGSNAGWYRAMEWTGGSRGGSIISLSVTGGSFTPVTYVIKSYKTFVDQSPTLKLEQYGIQNYLSKARITYDTSFTPAKAFVEVYKIATGPTLPIQMHQDKTLGYNDTSTVLTGTAAAGGGSVLEELPFTIEGTTMQKLTSRDVTLYGDGSTNAGKLKFNCSANTHYTEIVGPDHAGGSSYSLKLPNTLPSVSNQILEANALGTLSWIPTPSGGGGGGGTLNTVGITMPPAFSVGNSPLTGSGGTISIGVTGGSSGEFLAYNGQWATPAVGTASVTNGNPAASTGSALTISPNTGAVIVTSNRYAGGTNLGHVPAGGTGTTFLRGDGTWATPTAALDFYKTFTTDNGSNVVASGNDDTMQIIGGSGITTAGSTDKISIALNLATSIERGGIQIGYVENGKNYPVELSGEKAYVNVPWTGGSSGISFSGATSGGLATFSNSTTAAVSPKVTLNTNGLMQFDADGNSAGSIDFDPTGTRLKIGDLSSGNSGIVEIFTNGDRRFQIGLNGQIGLGTGASTGTNGQFLQSQGAGSPAIWTSSGAGGGSSGTSGMVQLADGSSGFTNSASLFWEIISGIKGKLVLGKNTGGAYDREGILRLVGGPNAAGTSGVGGTIELQSAVGKAGGSVASLKIQAPPSNSIDQEIVLPSALPTATTQILGISSISSSTVNTAWKTPAASNQPTLGFAPLSIYAADATTANSYTYYSMLVCDVDITITNAKVFVRSGTSAIYAALYSTTTGNLQTSAFTKLATFYKTTGVAVGINILPLQEGTATLTAGQTIMLAFSTPNQMIGGIGVNSIQLNVEDTSPTYPINFPTDPSSDIESLGSAGRKVAIHFYE